MARGFIRLMLGDTAAHHLNSSDSRSPPVTRERFQLQPSLCCAQAISLPLC